MATTPVAHQQQSRLLSLPRELRDEVYFYYFQEIDGYAHCFETNQLRCSNGDAIDLSLMRTCRMVAEETCALPLRANQAVFRPYHQETTTSDDGDF